jgi:holo-[acyl-carrier protein] synthase
MNACVRVGVDVVDVDQVRSMMSAAGRSFLEAGWTARELAYCAGQPERLAARWAAKEATMKALGTGIGDISLLDVEVDSMNGAPPRLVLRGGAAAEADRLGVSSWSVSLSHVSMVAVAVVIGCGGASDGRDH